MTDLIKLAILGSTGSIGQQTLDIVRRHPDKFKVVGLAAGKNTDLFSKQIIEFQPKFIYSLDEINLNFKVDMLSIEDFARHPDVDILVVAATGKAGLNPVIAAIRAGKTIAIANKEPLVMAGSIIMAEAIKHGIQIRPIDSEHSAIWQCLNGEQSGVARLIITASGGPFYGFDRNRLENVTVEEALRHPTWEMGKKVTVDSSTLMNKGLEVIEAHWLFSIPFNKIQIVIHQNSIVHSLVEFIDGSIKAQMSYPDMHYPIQYALTYPERIVSYNRDSLDIERIHNLVFERVKYDDFPCLKLALESGKKGGTCPAVLCAADEIAVELFLDKKIKFKNIPEIISEVLDQHSNKAEPSLGEIMEADSWARVRSLEIVRKRNLCY